MAVFGPAGLVIFAFIGVIGSLTAVYGLEQAAKRLLGHGPGPAR